MSPIKLTHGDHVRLGTWTRYPYDETTVEVGTCRGYATDTKQDPEESHQRALTQHHATAWTMLAPAVLTDSRAFNDRKAAERKAAFASAVTLSPGDAVEIEGERFVVVVPRGNSDRPRNSDAIHFKREA